MNELLLSIKEVQECGKKLANHYLEHGYLLLDIQTGTRIGKYPDDNKGGQNYFIRRNPIFVLGRPEGIEPAPRMNPASDNDKTND